MKVTINSKKCVRCGACEVLTQKVIISSGDKPAFVDQKANLKNTQIQENIRIAAETCPQKAIIIK